MNAKTLDTCSGAVLIVGIAEGIVPFIAKPTGWTPVWALPRHLDAPGWWIASLLVIAACVAGIAVLERLKQRAGK